MKPWIHRMTAVMLTVAVSMAAAGCGQAEKNQEEKPQIPAQEVEAKGRYVETELEVPEQLSDAMLLLGFGTGEKSQMEFILADLQQYEGDTGGFYHYRYDGTEWTQGDSLWIENLLEQKALQPWEICCGQDGKYYVGGMDSNNQYHLYRCEENGSCEEILKEVFLPQEQAEGNGKRLVPGAIYVNQNSEVLLVEKETAYLYRQDGTFAFSLEQDASDNRSYLGTRIFNTDEYITFLDGNLVRYDLQTGAISGTINCEGKDIADEGNGIIMEDGSRGMYLAGRSGLFHINQGASLWEQIIDGSLTTMGMQNLHLIGWQQGNDNDFYGVFQGEFGENIRVFHYTYDPDMAAVPPLTLTVYSLKDVASVHQAASLMQKMNPDVRVDYRVAARDGEEAVQEDMIRSLNMELLNGKGADVLILDGLPADTYREKGVLMDMREVIADINGKTPLLPFVVKDFTEADGAVYQMPIRLSFPAMMGEPEALKALESLDGIKNYQGELPLLAKTNYENIMRLLANIRYDELWGETGRAPGEADLIRYLEAVKAVGEKNGAKTEFTKAELEAPDGVRYFDNQVFTRGMEETPAGYGFGSTAATVMEINSVYSTALPWALTDQRPGRELQAVSGIYFPLSMVGINQASPQKETAEEFVRLLYSGEVQKIEFYQNENEGFPVLMSALEAWKDLERYVTIGTGSVDGDFLVGGWPGRERREQLVTMVSSLHQPVNIDQTMMRMMVDGAKGYLDGKETVQDAAAKINRQMELYQAE